MAYIGSIGEKVEIEVTIKGVFQYDTRFAYQTTTHYIISMEDAEGNALVWKTTSYPSIMVSKEVAHICKDGYHFDKDARHIFGGNDSYHSLTNGDVVTIKGSIKEHSVYNGVEQTALQRCKFTGVSHFEKSWSELKAEREAEQKKRKEEQLNSIKGEDFIWKMPYKQYKEHYSDCETVAGSFERPERGVCTIKVIIREGRLKNSGVRGEHFYGFDFSFDFEGKNTSCVFRAVSEENARKQLAKAFKGAENIELERVW